VPKSRAWFTRVSFQFHFRFLHQPLLCFSCGGRDAGDDEFLLAASSIPPFELPEAVFGFLDLFSSPLSLEAVLEFLSCSQEPLAVICSCRNLKTPP
jgi:hypothetical protein